MAARVLIPDEQLTETGKPLAHILRGHESISFSTDKLAFTDLSSSRPNMRLGLLRLLLVSPTEDVAPLPSKQVLVGKRELQCVGQSGRFDVTFGAGEMPCQVEMQLHESVPTHVAQYRVVANQDRSTTADQLIIQLRFQSSGPNAKSAFGINKEPQSPAKDLP